MELPIDVPFQAAVEHYFDRDEVDFILPNQLVRRSATPSAVPRTETTTKTPYGSASLITMARIG